MRAEILTGLVNTRSSVELVIIIESLALISRTLAGVIASQSAKDAGADIGTLDVLSVVEDAFDGLESEGG